MRKRYRWKLKNPEPGADEFRRIESNTKPG